MATTLLDTMATLPSGRIAQPLSIDELAVYLRRHYMTEAETIREERHRLRDILYRDGGVEEMHKLIDTVYQDVTIREKRKQWARWARFNNITKRVVNELSSVYQEPAVRQVEDEDNNAIYQLALELCDMHQVSRRINRMLNLHRALLVGPRVRGILLEDGTIAEPEPVIDVITPSNCRLLVHPNDPTLLVGVAIRLRPRTVGEGRPPSTVPNVPAWIVWSDAERFMMREDWSIIGDSFQPHDLDRIPYVFVALDPPADTTPWPGTAGEDLIAADMAVWFAAVNLLKEVKSATRQNIVSGNLHGAARDQAADSEMPIELPDGVAVTSQDMSMDLAQFRDTADHVLEHVANNYGMSAALIKHQGVQSAEARELMRVPLREMRREQQMVLRPFEHALAETMAAVFERDLPLLAFNTEGWRIDFGEAQTPLSPKEELERFEHERRLGLTNTVDYVVSRNPDMDEDSARKFVEHNVEMELWRNRAMRPLQAASGSMGDETPTGSLGTVGPPEDKEEEMAS
jgi:hypothetical protein